MVRLRWIAAPVVLNGRFMADPCDGCATQWSELVRPLAGRWGMRIGRDKFCRVVCAARASCIGSARLRVPVCRALLLGAVAIHALVRGLFHISFKMGSFAFVVCVRMMSGSSGGTWCVASHLKPAHWQQLHMLRRGQHRRAGLQPPHLPCHKLPRGLSRACNAAPRPASICN